MFMAQRSVRCTGAGSVPVGEEKQGANWLGYVPDTYPMPPALSAPPVRILFQEFLWDAYQIFTTESGRLSGSGESAQLSDTGEVAPARRGLPPEQISVELFSGLSQEFLGALSNHLVITFGGGGGVHGT